MMKYKVQKIGAVFSNNSIAELEKLFSSKADEGYKFHSIFAVQQAGCLGIGQAGTTYLAVFERNE